MIDIKNLAKRIVCNTWGMAMSNYSIGLIFTFSGLAMISLSILSILNRLDVLPEEIENKFSHITGLLIIGCLSFFIHHLYYTWAHKNDRPSNHLENNNNPLTLLESRALALNDKIQDLYGQLDEINKLSDDTLYKENRIKQITELIKHFSEELDGILPSDVIQSQQV